MFVRFRQTTSRLQASLIETRRADGKVRHEHIASLGSVPSEPSVADRIAFWARLHARLAKLGNRIDAESQARILASIHAKVPMVTADEQRGLQLANAKADAQFWDSLHNVHAGAIEEQKGLARTVATAIADGEATASSAEANATQARERIAAIERGEDVPGGLGKPLTREDFEALFTKDELRRMELFRRVGEFGEDAFELLLRMTRESHAHDREAERNARRLIKLLSGQDDPAAVAKAILESGGSTVRGRR
jgi:hypothetical protein